MKKKLIAFAVLAIVIIIVVGYVAVFFYSAPDISGVAIESTEPSWNMVPSGRYERWYSFKVSLSIEINNPTAYKVAIRIRGECEFTVTTDPNYLQADKYSYNNTADFILAPYSKYTYTLVVYECPFSASDPNSIKTLHFNSYHVDELRREIYEG